MKFNFNRKKSKGVAAIEFAIGFLFFWYMIAAWVEMSFMSYVSAIGDIAISRASQVAKKYEGSSVDGFVMAFNDELKKQNSLWKYAVDSNDFFISVTYFDSFSDLLKYDESSEEPVNNPTNSSIAIYKMTYSYHPVFNLFLDSDAIMSREMIVIQEYQRPLFSQKDS